MTVDKDVPSVARRSFGPTQIARVRNKVGVPGRRRGDEIVRTARDALSSAIVANASEIRGRRA